MTDISFSQNFLRDPKFVNNLIKEFGVFENDTILDIGAGKGIITDQLIRYSNSVIAIELDTYLYENLVKLYDGAKNVKVVNEDFIEYETPKIQYKTFSNIPFSQTAAIIKKLTSDINFVDGCLVLQKDAIFKYAGEQLNSNNSLQSIILFNEFEVSIQHSFLKSDFSPSPAFNIVLARFKRRDNSLIKEENKELFKDFVTYIFNNSTPNISKNKLFSEKQLSRFKQDIKLNPNAVPKQLKFSQYKYLFEFIMSIFKDKVEIFKGEYNRNIENEKKIVKINRTRKDESWTKY